MPWAKDTSKNYFEGFWLNTFWPLIKSVSLLAIYYFLQKTFAVKYCILLCILITIYYQYVIGRIYGVKRLKIMEYITLFSGPKSIVNTCGVQCYEKPIDVEVYKDHIRHFHNKRNMKCISYLVNIMGDYYW